MDVLRLIPLLMIKISSLKDNYCDAYDKTRAPLKDNNVTPFQTELEKVFTDISNYINVYPNDAADDTTITTKNTSSETKIEDFKNLHFFIVTVVMAVVAVALTVSTTVACYRYYSTVKRRTKNNYDELDIRLNERAFYHTPKLTDPVQTPSNSGARPRDAINQSLRVTSSPRQPMETDANPYSEIRNPYNN